MRKVLSIILATFLISACTTGNVETSNEREYRLYTCDVPVEILEMSPNNEVPWDCTWEASYNNGRVKLITGDDGNLVAIVRTTPDLSCDSLHVTTP